MSIFTPEKLSSILVMMNNMFELKISTEMNPLKSYKAVLFKDQRFSIAQIFEITIDFIGTFLNLLDEQNH
jgi:hypothetical protein